MINIGLVGDFDDTVPAHRAIPIALGLAAESVGIPVGFEWVPIDAIDSQQRPVAFDGIWCVPASPYRSMEGATCAIHPQRIPNIVVRARRGYAFPASLDRVGDHVEKMGRYYECYSRCGETLSCP